MICDSINSVKARISDAAGRNGRNPAGIKLLGATKKVSVSKIREAVECGLTLLGENYIQEAKTKIEELGSGIEWHFIGRLQVNKAKYAVKLFDLIHSLDSIDLARELNRRAAAVPRVMPVLIEVNLGGEETKGGIQPEELIGFSQDILLLKNLNLRGLMTIPPFFDDPEKARPYFTKLRELKESLSQQLGVDLKELSMGMTGDFEAAIEEGSTIVRIGTAIFGPRPPK